MAAFFFLILFFAIIEAATVNYQFDVQVKNIRRVCHTKPIITVNGMFPGPTIRVKEGDAVVVNVTNNVRYNLSIHWHGVKQYRNGWADGPAYITQCPIQTGNSYTYRFTISGQQGTLWWHAHILWLRATVYGTIVIMPRNPLPFPHPDAEFVILLGEWWNNDVEEVESMGDKMGLPPNISDAHTINGMPGPVFPCREKDIFTMEVEHGKTYMLRVVNAALNDELFFGIANHSLTVVEVDAIYTKPFSSKAIFIGPGQTTNVLLKANQVGGKYIISTRTFMNIPFIRVDKKTATAFMNYKGIQNTVKPSLPPPLPAGNDLDFVLRYTNKLKSLNSLLYPAHVPVNVDRNLFYTISLGQNPCPTCVKKTRLVGAINNISFLMPPISILQSHYFGIKGVYTTDFPDQPPTQFNYTGTPLPNVNVVTLKGTRLSKVAFNSTVELILQDTSLLTLESHPFHLHGYNFFVVGSGMGNFNPETDPAKYNLVDPIERNTVGVPSGGWVAIRFIANNPGVWFFHCHIEVHTSWGLKMAFLVEDGPGEGEGVLPPPNDLPKC